VTQYRLGIGSLATVFWDVAHTDRRRDELN